MIVLGASMFIDLIEDKLTDCCPLINTLSVLAFNIILVELRIICGEVNVLGSGADPLYDIKLG
jgi:hypothetical protein